MDSILQDLIENSIQLYEQNKHKEVEEMLNTFLKEALNEAPGLRAKALNHRGEAKLLQDKFDESVKDFDEALSLDSTLAEASFNRGKANLKLDKKDEAKVDFESALEKDPSNEKYQKAINDC